MPQSPDPSSITLQPAEPSDFPALSTLECSVFYEEEFSVVAFGPLRDSPKNIAQRAAQMARPCANPKDWNVYTKAILKSPDTGKEEIVGFAGWRFAENADSRTGADLEESKAKEGPKELRNAEEILKDNENSWGPGANFKFCEDAFIVADEFMSKSCEGKPYCKLHVLVVSPQYQRMGIGTRLLEAGLKEADRLGLQSILGASPDGEGLYKRYGFTEYEVMNLKLWEYEGGEGMGVARHVVMHRPVQHVAS